MRTHVPASAKITRDRQGNRTQSRLTAGATLVFCLMTTVWIAGDEALMVSGGGSTQLVFLDRGQTMANNLGAPPASIFRASLQGRLALVTMAGEWRLVSPFRNLPFNQWPPFKVAELPTRYKSKDAPEPLQWAPDGRKFLIRLNRTITIHHAGGGHRSEERRVGKECRLLCRSRWSPYH